MPTAAGPISWLFLLSCLLPLTGPAAQTTPVRDTLPRLQLRLLAADTPTKSNYLPARPDSTDRYPDSTALRRVLADYVEDLRAATYYEASLDSLLRTDSTHFTALLHYGPPYRWAEFSLHPEIPDAWAARAGFRRRKFRPDAPLDRQKFSGLRDSLVQSAASEGYPFARIYLDSIEFAGPGRISGRLRLERGRAVQLADLEVPEAARIDPRFLARMLGLRTGDPYNQRRLRNLPARLRELSYLELKGPPRVRFEENLATVELPLGRRAASRFDFVLGVLPNSDQTGRLLITGDLRGEIQNGFGRGERLAVRFEQLRPQTQELEIAVDFPFLFYSPFGLAATGDLYRRDTQYLDLNYRVAATYPVGNTGGRLEVFAANRQTRLLGFDADRLLATARLPDTLDVSRSSFGLTLEQRRLDYRFNPRRGWEVRAGGGAGLKTVKRNAKILDLGAENLYDSLQLRAAQYRLELAAAFYQPLFPATTLRFGLDGGGLFGPQPVLINEQYRLGGSRQLRGFDEQSVFASRYLIGSAEFRLLLSQNSFLFLFTDYALLDISSRADPPGADTFVTALGLGTGINFETRAGIFGLSLAVGRRRGEVLDFGAPKVHFGYLSLF